MSVRKIASMAWSEIGADHNYPQNIATDIIENAIREAAKPLVEMLELVHESCDISYRDDIAAVLAAWKGEK